MRAFVMSTLLFLLTAPGSATAQQPTPVFDFESVLDTYFDDESGLISLGDYVVAFAPEGPFKGEVAVVDAASNVIARFPFLEDAKRRNGVFARVQVQGPADVKLSEPGVYNLVFLVNGNMVTRLAFAMEQASAGDDPFNPVKTFRFDGLWRAYAHLTTDKSRANRPLPQLHIWLGGKDLRAGASKDGFQVTLYRNGEVVAHSKPNHGIIRPGHFERTRVELFEPHEKKASANAEFFTLESLLVDGVHELRVTRSSDGATIRSYDFSVEGGEIARLAQTNMGYEPGIDYIMPRVVKKGSTAFEMVETIWILDEPANR